MSIEEIIANIANQMRIDIDREIMDLYILSHAIKMGWTETTMGGTGSIHTYEVSKWLSENIKGEYKNIHGQLWFEDGEDAVLFMLRWS